VNNVDLTHDIVLSNISALLMSLANPRALRSTVRLRKAEILARYFFRAIEISHLFVAIFTYRSLFANKWFKKKV